MKENLQGSKNNLIALENKNKQLENEILQLKQENQNLIQKNFKKQETITAKVNIILFLSKKILLEHRRK